MDNINLPCPLCQAPSKFGFNINGYQINDCTKCKHRFACINPDKEHVSNIYDHSYFIGGGAGYPDYLEEEELLIKSGRHYANKIAKYIPVKGKMLDVGSAAGFILKGFIEEGWSGVGIEPNPEMVAYGKQNLKLDLSQGSLENYQTAEKFDLITMIQVVAHFYQPVKAFQNAGDLLKKNGMLLIETWNRNSISAKLFGKHWHEYSPPSVLHYFSFNGLNNFLKRFGFIKIANGYSLKKISGAHAKSMLEYRIGNSFLLKYIPKKISIPYPSEDLFWVLYQKQS
jgi:SAM-dependent methyltransferase